MRMRFLSFFLMTGLLFSANAQEISYHHQYSIEDGLAERTVQQILRDGAGRFWIRCERNIQLYDGKHFIELITPEKFDASLLKSATSLSNGDIALLSKTGPNWIVSHDGLEFLLLDSLNKDYERFISAQNSLYRISFDKKEQISRIYEHQDGSFTELASIKHSSQFKQYLRAKSREFLVDDKKNLLVKDENSKLNKIKSKVDQIIGEQDEFVWIRKRDSIFKIDLAGNFLYQDSLKFSRALLRHDNLGRTVIAFSNHRQRFTKALIFDDYGSNDFSAFCSTNKLNTINDFFSEDFRRQLLSGTYNGLRYFHFAENIKTYLADSRPEGNFGKVTWWITQRNNGKIYFTLESGDVYSIDRNEILERIEIPNKFTGKQLTHLYAHYLKERDELLSFLIAGGKNYLQFFDFENSLDTIQILGRYYDYVDLDKHHVLMVGNINTEAAIGVINVESKELVSETILEDGGARFFCVKSDHKGSWFVGSNSGLYQLSLNNTEMIDDSKYTLKKLNDFPTLDILVRKNDLIQATHGKGALNISKEGKILSHLDQTKGLANDAVLSLAQDNKKNIWMSTLGGVNVLDSNFLILKSLRRLNGLASNEMNHQSMLIDDRQRAYFGSINGLTVIFSKSLESKPVTSSLILNSIDFKRENENISIDVSSAKDVKIPFHTSELTLNVEIYDYFKNSVNHDRRYQYIFRDRLTEESIYLKDESIELTNVPKGKFHIDWIPPPTSTHGEYSKNSIELYRETFWDKYGLGILLFALCATLLFYTAFLLVRRRIEQQKTIRERQKVQMNTLQLKALQSQMNPHFIYNALGSIQYYIQREESDLAEEYLTDFALLMRRILDSASVDKISLSKEIELLELYIRLEQIRLDHKFEYIIKTDSHLDQEVKIPPMILQPFVENAINHGLVHRTKPGGNLTLQFIEEEGLMRCIIEDNGVGRTRSVDLRTKKHNPKAMGIIQERRKLMNKIYEQNITISVSDLLEKDELYPGTRVVVDF